MPLYEALNFGRFLLLDPHSTMMIFLFLIQRKKIQFNGFNSSIQERVKALEVVQYIKDTYHDGKCEVASVGEWGIRLETLYLIS